MWELLILDNSFVTKSGCGTRSAVRFWSGVARPARCALWSPSTVRSRLEMRSNRSSLCCGKRSPMRPGRSSRGAGWLPTVGTAAGLCGGEGKSWSYSPWGGCAGTRLCASPTLAPTNGGQGDASSSIAASTSATGRAWLARRRRMRMWTYTTGSCTASLGSIGCGWCTSCPAGPTRRWRSGAPVQHRPDTGTGMHLPLLRHPFPN